MPNGGADNCGTCWFNARNGGQSGHKVRKIGETDYCTIRNQPVDWAYFMYCANHPYHSPDRDQVPVGPMMVVVTAGYGRGVHVLSPDTEEVRVHLLDIIRSVAELPHKLYPGGRSREEAAAWQLGEFGEQRAIPDLRRIAEMPPAVVPPPSRVLQSKLVAEARDALAKIEGHGLQPAEDR